MTTKTEGKAEQRLCVLCNTPLTRYNESDRCLHHGPKGPPSDTTRDSSKWFETSWFGGTSAPEADIKAVIRAVCVTLDITPEQFTGRSRVARIVWARHVSMYLLHDDLGMPYDQVGQILQRDRSTVMYGRRKVAAALEKRTEVRETLKNIRATYRGEQKEGCS